MYKNENYETVHTMQVLLFSSLRERKIKGSAHFRDKAGRKIGVKLKVGCGQNLMQNNQSSEKNILVNSESKTN